MRRLRGWAVGATLAAVAVVGGVGCSDDSGSAASTTSEAGAGPGSGWGEDRSGSAAADEPIAGGTLRLGIGELASLDPADASPESPSASIAADLLFDGLTTVRAGNDGLAEPALAQRWETPDGGRTWRFFLRPDAVFADGTPVTAADVEQSLERVIVRGPASLVAGRLDVVADVRAPEASVVEVELERPMASLPELLASPTLGVVSAATVFAGGDVAANGSGPFRLAGIEGVGDAVRLVRARDGEALLDEVELHQFDDLGDAVDAFEAGELEWTLVPPDRAESVAESVGTDGFVPFQAELFFGFNLADPTFADARFRRAIVMAMDREAVVAAVYLGFAEALDGVVPAGVPGSDDGRCGPGCAYDVDGAREALAEAFPDGNVPEVVIDHEDGVEETALARAVEQQLEAAGIPAALRGHRPDAFGAFAVSGQQALVRLGWIGTWPGPDAYLDPLFRSGAPDNVTGFSDPAVDALLDQAAATLDPAERRRLLGEAESLILAAAPIVPIAQFHLLSAAAPDVRGLELSIDGTFDAKAVWLAA